MLFDHFDEHQPVLFIKMIIKSRDIPPKLLPNIDLSNS